MRRTLNDNIKRLERVTEAIGQLSKPDIYYCSTYGSQAKSDKANKRILKRTIRSMERLNVVIKKQSIEEVRKMFPHFCYKYSIKK